MVNPEANYRCIGIWTFMVQVVKVDGVSKLRRRRLAVSSMMLPKANE
jgi:hypothetical protein